MAGSSLNTSETSNISGRGLYRAVTSSFARRSRSVLLEKSSRRLALIYPISSS